MINKKAIKKASVKSSIVLDDEVRSFHSSKFMIQVISYPKNKTGVGTRENDYKLMLCKTYLSSDF